jgi:4-hydroxy-4-methyl-2-oxoglutarate aldolase
MRKLLSPEVLESLSRIDTPTISNAIEKLNVRDLTTGFAGCRIRCMFPEMGIKLGYAMTAQLDGTSPGPPAVGDGFRQLADAVEASPKPVILVWQDIGPNPGGAAVFGEFAATLMQRLGAVAIVTNGAVRDIHEIHDLGFQLFAAGASPSHGNPRFVRVGVPVIVDGLSIEPGNLVHCDVNGVLQVPHDIAHLLPDQVEIVRSTERAAFALIKGPDFSVEAAFRRMGSYDDEPSRGELP